MKEVLSELSQNQIAFICHECLITEDELMNMKEDSLYDKVYERMCNIEIDEVCSKGFDEDDSERCEIASDIVTILGNTLMPNEE